MGAGAGEAMDGEMGRSVGSGERSGTRLESVDIGLASLLEEVLFQVGEDEDE